MSFAPPGQQDSLLVASDAADTALTCVFISNSPGQQSLASAPAVSRGGTGSSIPAPRPTPPRWGPPSAHCTRCRHSPQPRLTLQPNFLLSMQMLLSIPAWPCLARPWALLNPHACVGVLQCDGLSTLAYRPLFSSLSGHSLLACTNRFRHTAVGLPSAAAQLPSISPICTVWSSAAPACLLVSVSHTYVAGLPVFRSFLVSLCTVLQVYFCRRLVN